MQNLKLYRGEDFRFDTAEEGNIVRIELEYMKTDSMRHRGIYFRMTPIKIEKTDHGHTEAFGLFAEGNLRLFVSPLARKTPKVLAALAAKLDPIVPELIALYAQDQAAVLPKVREALGVVS